MSYSPRSIAEVVCEVLGGSTPSAILADHRGSPRTADLRAVCMLIWRETHPENGKPPRQEDVAAAFKRDRRNVGRGLERIAKKRLPSPMQLRAILRLLRTQTS